MAQLYDKNGNPIPVGDEVRIVRQQLSGIPIAQINGEQLYAPQGGGGSALTNAEVRKWQFLPDYLSYKFGKNKTAGAWFERFKILHFSDTHGSDTSGNNGNTIEALELANGLVDVVVDTGDNSNGVATSQPSSVLYFLNKYNTAVSTLDPNKNIKKLICNGNHDVPNITKKQFFDPMCSLMPNDFVFGDAENYRTYGYEDITGSTTVGTIRIITLDPYDYNDGQFMNPYGTRGTGGWMNAVFSQKQINWLITTLRDAVSRGYKVITAMHYSFGDNTVWEEDGTSAKPDANYHQDPFMIPDIIDAMQKKTTLVANYPDDEGLNNITINEDFSNIGNLHYICHLFGHIHSKNDYRCQKTDGSKKYDILMLGEHNMGSSGYAINKVKLQPDTLNSIKLSVLEIDTYEQCVYRVSYGGYIAYNQSETARTKKIPYRFTDN